MTPRLDYGAIPSGIDDGKRPLNAIERRDGIPRKKVLLFTLPVVVIFFIYAFHSSTVDSKDDGGVHGWIPDAELGLRGVEREEDASPSLIWGNKTNGPLPTNSWYLVRLVNWKKIDSLQNYLSSFLSGTTESRFTPCCKPRRIYTSLYCSIYY
jgi:hypothetical protein